MLLRSKLFLLYRAVHPIQCEFFTDFLNQCFYFPLRTLSSQNWHTITSPIAYEFSRPIFCLVLLEVFRNFLATGGAFGCHRCISYRISQCLVPLANSADAQKVDFWPQKDGTIFFLLCNFLGSQRRNRRVFALLWKERSSSVSWKCPALFTFILAIQYGTLLSCYLHMSTTE